MAAKIKGTRLAPISVRYEARLLEDPANPIEGWEMVVDELGDEVAGEKYPEILQNALENVEPEDRPRLMIAEIITQYIQPKV